MTASETEPHPYRHRFNGGRLNDEIYEENSRGVPIVIRRSQWCEWCGTQRIMWINVIQWERVGYYQYRGRPKDLQRLTRQDWLRDEFLRTTDLPAKVIKALQKARRES